MNVRDHLPISVRTVTVSGPALPHGRGQAPFAFVRLQGKEGLCGLFEYEIELKTSDKDFNFHGREGNVDLREMNGRELTVHIQLDGMGTGLAGRIGEGTREISGIVDRARYLRAEGRHFVYGLTLRPWLWLATLNGNSRIFENRTDIEIIEEVLSAYSFPVERRLDVAKYPTRAYRTQCDESDYTFIARLMQHWGISWFFAHSEGKHRLILVDHVGGYPRMPSEAYQVLAVHPPGVRIDEEHLDDFSVVDAVVAGRYTTNAYSFTQPRGNLTASSADARETGQNTGALHQEVYEFPGEHAQPATDNRPWDEGEMIARIRMEEIRSRGLRCFGKGNLRAVVPGHTMHVSGHPQLAANREYVVLDTHLTVEDVAEAAGEGQRWHCRVAFECHPAQEVFRPALSVPWPVVTGPQSATVVGPEGHAVWPDRFGRVRVQFPWDRFNRMSCWVRVATPWAGSQHGQVGIPRIGSEVLVMFLDGGNPDKPIVMGAVPNSLNMPPWQLPDQHALTGIRSREQDGSGSGHLVFDDTKGEIQSQLSSDHQRSQLSLGYLTRIEDNRGRQDHRGEGFELRTDGHGAIRGANGLLVSTEARPDARAHHKDMGETLDRLHHAQHAHHTTAQLARHHQAQDSEQQDVATVLKAQHEEICGSGEVNGELTEPHLVMASAAALAATAARSTHLHSGEHLAVTTGKHASFASSGGFFASAARRIALFAHSLGIRLVAATDHIALEAQGGDIKGTARRNIHFRALGDIVLEADQGIVLKVGQTYQRWTPSQIVEGMRGTKQIHAAGFCLDGPDGMSPSSLALPHSDFDQEVYLHLPDGSPARNRRFRLTQSDGSVIEGVTDMDGLTTFQQSQGAENVTIEIGEAASGQ
ncbi:type VI secretion system Vgr family protein [Cupriavidus sp. a3]|uniref:type VI secretion system Vgr family protein n=1 Tax=Cupriavidus sp. a3 TaxID=3242158 RepID=UPI003D9C5FA2